MSKAFLALLVAASMVFGFTSPAFAHDPIFITDDQTTPDTGPFMPDGSISWALYGSVLDNGDTRGFEFDLRDGDEVFVSLLIPNLSPEVDLSDEDLPIIELESPDGTMTVISPVVRDVFDEPFSNTSYVTLAEHREPAQAGRYRGLIIGGAPSRFSVAIGETEIFFTETERSGDRPSNFAEITEPLTEWYTTPPGGEPGTVELADGEAEIDLDMIDDAMESGEAEAPEGSTDAPAADETAAVDDAMAAEDEAEADAVVVDEDVATAEDDAVVDDETAGSAGEQAAASADEAAATTQSATALGADGGSSTTWVAPVALGVIAAVGAGMFVVRRRDGN